MTKLWTLYEMPNPLVYVARLSVIDGDGARYGGRVVSSSSLPTIRAELQKRGLTRVPPDPMDDPQIVELWL